MGQNQDIGNSSVENSDIQQTQTGRDAVSFQNSQDNQVTINNIILRMFGKSESPQVDWEWGKLILEKKQLPDIRKRLTDTLGRKRISMDVSLQEQLSWVNRTLQIDDQDYGTLDANKLLIETYGRDDIAGKLLILGAPGAGKTTALLSLAEQLVEGALKNPQTVIPVIFELSTWRDDNQSIEQWLIEQLYELHGGNRKKQIYERWLEQRVLLPLLDGLDELRLERQKKCTIKLEEFAQHYPHVVVCCRMKEFAAVDLKLKTFRGAVCLQPLSDIQIQNYLRSLNRSELWSVIQKNADLKKLLKPTSEGDPGFLRVPLFVKLVVDVYDPTQPISSKADLLEKYIDRQLSKDVREQERRKEKERGKWAYKKVEDEPHWRQTHTTLSWIAKRLQGNNSVELIIEQMQPSWIGCIPLLHRYRLIYRRNFHLIYGLIIALIIIALINEPIYGLIGLIYSIGGLITDEILEQSGEIYKIDIYKIEPLEAFEIPISHTKGRKIFKYSIYLLSSLILGSILGLIVGLILGSIWGLIWGLIFILIFGLMVSFMLIFGLIIGVIYGLKQELKERSRPNQGIWNSFQNMLWTTALSCPFGVIFAMTIVVVLKGVEKKQNLLDILSIVFRNLPHLLLPGLLISLLLFGFLAGGGQACLQHLSLRLVLWQSGAIPWNLAQFLDYCVERRLLLRVGGRYRFLHRELLDHFAQSHHV
jgi:hypothetical protein